jgi:hypothetical protein
VTTDRPDPISWAALGLALWPLWVAYAVIVVVALAEMIAGRKS